MPEPGAPAFAHSLARRVAEASDPVAVLLFGSWAKGTADRPSDVDLLVVLNHRPTPAQRAAVVDATSGVPMKVDVLLWTLADLAAARADPHSFAGSTLGRAIVLRGELP